LRTGRSNGPFGRLPVHTTRLNGPFERVVCTGLKGADANISLKIKIIISNLILM